MGRFATGGALLDLRRVGVRPLGSRHSRVGGLTQLRQSATRAGLLVQWAHEADGWVIHPEFAAVGAFAYAGKYPAHVREVTVVVSDPWEFVDEHGSNVFAATVRDRSEDLVLLEVAGQLYVANPCGTPEGYSLTPTTAELVRGGPESPRVSWRLGYLEPAPAGTGVSG